MLHHRAAAARALAGAVAATLVTVGTVGVAGASVAPRAPAPSISSVSVTSLNQGESTVAIIEGSNFRRGATVSIGPDVVSRVTSRTGSTITVHWTVSSTAQVSTRTLTVTDPGGSSGTERHAVRVGFAPILTKWAVGQGATDFSTTLVRPTFRVQPRISFSGSGVSVEGTSLSSTGQLVVELTVASSAKAAWRSMRLTDGLAQWSVAHGLKVRPAPSVRSVTPLGQGATQQTVLVKGTGFESCKSKAPGFAISGTGVTVNWASDAIGTLIYANLTVAANAPIGPRNVTVTNCDTGGSITASGAFAVLGAPSVDSVPAIALGVSRVEAVHGTNFTPDTTLSAAGTGVSFTAVHYVSPTKLRAMVTVSATAATGPRGVTAGDTGGSSTTTAAVLAIDPLPTEASVSPGGIGANTTVAVTLHGTGFEPGASVVALRGAAADPAVKVGDVAVTSSTTVTATVSALDATTLGTDDLEIVNPDGGTVSTLTVHTDPGPVLTSLKPSTSAQGVLLATFTAPKGAPSGEAYGVRACVKGAKHLTCVTRASFHSGGAISGLVAGSRYYVVVTAVTDGTYFASASNLAGPAVATLALTAPVITSVGPSTTRAGAVTVKFSRPASAPKSQRYTAKACRNTAMTSGCVSHAGYTTGAPLAGLVWGGSYFVTVSAVASSGYLAATSKASTRVQATVQLDAPKITATSYASGALEIDYARSGNATTSQAYTATACRNKAMTSDCVVHQDYRSGKPFSGLKDVSYYVEVTAVASSGYLAAPSAVVDAVRG